MIVYNGVSINSVAPVMIEDIRVSPIKYNPVTRPRAIRFGSEFVRMGGGERTVTVTFALLDDNRITRHESIMNLSKWARTDAEYKLELPTDPARYLMCVCTAKPEPSTRQWWESKLRLVFTCVSDPYWISGTEKSIACGTQFNVLGDAPPLMRIERTVSGSAASNQTYSNGVQSMTFSTIPVGDMVIDLNRQTAAVGNSSIMQYYKASGSFIIPRTGAQTITGTGTVKYRERYE
jgi:phage-related protein